MLNKIRKEDIFLYLITIIITILFCQNFLQMHYSSDTYVLFDLGYMAYPSKYFLLDGRLISTIICYMAGILNIPINIYVISMDLLGMIFIGTAIFLMYKILEKILESTKTIIKICLIAGCFILILNQFALEYLLFPESAVMCLGVLLDVIAVKVMIDNKKYKYMKIFILLLIATFCYQGVLNIFPVLAIMVYIVKQIKDKRGYKIKEKEFTLEMIKLAIIVISELTICFIVLKIFNQLLNSDQDRRMHLVNFEAVLLRGKTVSMYLNELWNKSMHMLPNHTGNVVIVSSIIMLVVLKTPKEFIMQYLLLLLVTFTICIVPMYIFNTGICGRVNVPLMMIWGASLIILLAQSQTIEEKRGVKLVYFLIIISFIINNIFIMRNITEHIASNKVEENMGRTIKRVIEDYEKENKITVTKFGYLYDRDPQQHATGIKPMQSLTERKLACSWSILSTMNFYCERKFELVGVTKKITDLEVWKKDYIEFSEEQIVFDEDKVYLIVY